MASVPMSSSSQSLEGVKKRRHVCTHCGSEEVYRQRPRGLIERHVARVFHFAPYWCAACDRRCYLRPNSHSRNSQYK